MPCVLCQNTRSAKKGTRTWASPGDGCCRRYSAARAACWLDTQSLGGRRERAVTYGRCSHWGENLHVQRGKPHSVFLSVLVCETEKSCVELLKTVENVRWSSVEGGKSLNWEYEVEFCGGKSLNWEWGGILWGKSLNWEHEVEFCGGKILNWECEEKFYGGTKSELRMWGGILWGAGDGGVSELRIRGGIGGGRGVSVFQYG